jgi:hypothetical protein
VSVERVILHYSHTRARAIAPTDLVLVERVILHYSHSAARATAPTDLVSVERVILHYQRRETPPAPTDLGRWSA